MREPRMDWYADIQDSPSLATFVNRRNGTHVDRVL